MNKLPETFKKKWVKALKSSKFKQGRGCLHRDGRYCCLGVACVVGGMDKVPRSGLISKKFKNIVPEILIGKNSLTDRLAFFNDVKEKSFEKIADYIEKYL